MWELQSGPRLTVGELAERLGRLDSDLPVRVNGYEGEGCGLLLAPVEVGLVGPADGAPVLVITVAALDRD